MSEWSLETGWKTVLGNAEQSGLFHGKTKFPLKISDRAWWLKVTLPKRKGGKSSGTVPMDLSTVNTGNVVNSESTKTKQTKQTTDCKRNVAAVVPVDVVTKDVGSKDQSKDTSKDSVIMLPLRRLRRSRVGQEVLARSRSNVGNLNLC